MVETLSYRIPRKAIRRVTLVGRKRRIKVEAGGTFPRHPPLTQGLEYSLRLHYTTALRARRSTRMGDNRLPFLVSEPKVLPYKDGFPIGSRVAEGHSISPPFPERQRAPRAVQGALGREGVEANQPPNRHTLRGKPLVAETSSVLALTSCECHII